MRLICFFGLFFLAGCNFIPQQPKITDLWALQVGYQHDAALTSCDACHNTFRPTSCNVTSIALANSDHFKAQDCFICHVNPNSNAYSWKNFNHKNYFGDKVGKDSTGRVVLDCTACHEQNRPATTAGGGAHDAVGNCGACHVVPDATVNKLPGWLPALVSHTPTPTSCLACHAQDKPIGVVPNRVNGFDHAAMWGTECKSCHMANAGTSWSGGYFDHGPNGSVVKSVTCSPCHDDRQHESGQLCSRCHSPVYPTGGAAGWWDNP